MNLYVQNNNGMWLTYNYSFNEVQWSKFWQSFASEGEIFECIKISFEYYKLYSSRLSSGNVTKEELLKSSILKYDFKGDLISKTPMYYFADKLCV